MLGTEGAETLLTESGRRRRRRVALKEGQRDLAGDVGEDRLGAGPERVEGGLELVVGRDPLGHQVGSRPHRGTQGTGVLAVGLERSQPMNTQTQVLADGLGVSEVGLGPGSDLGLAPRLYRIRRHRHHRVAGLQQPVHQPAIGSLDRHRQLGWLAEPGEAAHQVLEPDGAVRDRERGQCATCAVVHTHRVFLRRPVDACEHSNLLDVSLPPSMTRTRPGRSLTGALGASLCCRSRVLGGGRRRRCRSGPRGASLNEADHSGPHREPDTLAESSLRRWWTSDLAADQPDKLHDLQRLWLIEAGKYQVLPLDDRRFERFNADMAGRPQLIRGHSQLLFAGMGRLSENSVIVTKNKSLSITASITVPEGGANGVLIAQGGAFGGFSLYLTDGRPAYCYNLFGLQQFKVHGDAAVPSGEHQVRAEFTYDGGGLGKGGDVTLLVDGDKVGSGRVEATVPMLFSADETTDVGSDSATPVSDEYGPKDSAFTGRIHWIQLDGDAAAEDADHLICPEERLRIAMARQ